MTSAYLISVFSLMQNSPYSIVATALVTALIAALIIHILWRKLREDERSKYEFITIMAHKFRTPLTHIKWVSEELSGNTQETSTREGLKEIQKADKNLVGLTTTLIELTDSDTDHALYSFEATDLCDFVKTIGETARRTFQEKNIFFSVACDSGPVFAKIDRPRMEFAVQVLMDNAFAYTPTGKKVEISVGGSGHNAVISVKDGGIGIRESDVKKIFGKFFRADNARAADTEGFGIGLYLARSVVKKHKGKITAFSEGEGRGSVFNIILPRSR